MSDTLKSCEYCSKEFTAQRSTAKFCSAACKLNFNRKQGIDKLLTDKGLPPTIQAKDLPVPSKKEETILEPTYKDGQIIRDRPGGPRKGDLDWPGSDSWWVYGTADEPNKTWDRVCVRCGKNYTTPLQLMRFCSEDCKSEIMIVIANGPHENYKKWAKLT